MESIDPETGEWFGPPSPGLTHVVCCNPDEALCGWGAANEPWRPDEGTEDCLTCLRIETDLNREHRGCPVPWCREQPWTRRLFRSLWWLIAPRSLQPRR